MQENLNLIKLIMKKICTFLLIAFSAYSNAQSNLNVKLNEINFGASSSPTNFIKLNDLIIFAANRYANEGLEPWCYNSVTKKSTLLKDIFPFSNSGIPTPSSFVKVNNKIYFLGRENFSGYQIWETNGTPAGTVKAKDINSNYFIDELVVVGNKIFFYQNKELWSFDTVSNNLLQLKTFEYSGNVKLYSFNNQLFLAANDGISGKEVWKSDGTVAGTTLLKDIALNSGSSISNDFKILTLNNGKFYFIANTSTGYQLYESDGTTAGTISVKPIQGIGELNGASAGNYFVFSGFDPAGGGIEPWISDGTAAGTKILKDILPGNTSSMGNSKFFKINNKIYFDTNSNGISPSFGNYIWETDGTEVGTVLFNTPTNNILYGKSSDEQHLILTKPNELNRFWVANGNSTQTFEITGIGMPSDNSFIDLNSKIYLAGSTAKNGMELFSLDPVLQEATLASDISRFESSSPHSYELLNNNLIFIAADKEFGNQIYKRDKATQQLNRLTSMSSGSSTGIFTDFSDTFFKVGNYLYTKNNSTNLRSILYRTDGSTANSIAIPTPDITTDNTSLYANLSDNTLLFSAYNNIIGTELWKIDNTSNTPVLVKDISTNNMGSLYNTDTKTVVINGYAYFVAKDDNGKAAIWKSDGTANNTLKAIQFIHADGSDGEVKVLGTINNKLLFTKRKENSNLSQSELWISDGDQASAVLLKSHTSPITGNIKNETEIFNNKLYYIAYGSPSGLYATDGTVSGTTLVAYNQLSLNAKFKKCGNKLFFTNNSNSQLWVTDGTGSGTFNSSNISYSSIKDMSCVNNYLYFMNGDNKYIMRSGGTFGDIALLNIFIENDENQFWALDAVSKLATDNEKLYLTISRVIPGEELYEVTDFLPYLSINENDIKNTNSTTNIQIYPNPVTDVFSIKTKGDDKIEKIKIFDTSGKLVKNIIFNNDKINIADLPSGLYFLKIKTNKGDFFTKIIKK